MKKLVLLCAAIFTMAQLNAATPEVAAAEAPTSTVAADEDNGVVVRFPGADDAQGDRPDGDAGGSPDPLRRDHHHL